MVETEILVIPLFNFVNKIDQWGCLKFNAAVPEKLIVYFVAYSLDGWLTLTYTKISLVIFFFSKGSICNMLWKSVGLPVHWY